MAKFIQPSPQEWIDMATGLRLISKQWADQPRGDPRTVSLQSTKGGGTHISFGCGCEWQADFSGVPYVMGINVPLPGVCPNHDVAASGLPYGSQVFSGSVTIKTSPFGSSWQTVDEDEAEQPRPDLELSFDTEPIIGWRMWRIIEFQRHGGVTEPRLAPLTERAPWQPRERVTAVCDSHEAPWRDCMCGIWALRDEHAAIDKALQHGRVAFGEVYLWGRVMEFEHGWRGRYAYPKQIRVVCPARELIDATALGSYTRSYTPGGLIADYTAHLETQKHVAADLARIYGVPADVWQPPVPEVVEPVEPPGWMKYVPGLTSGSIDLKFLPLNGP